MERITCSGMLNLSWLPFTIFITISPSTSGRTFPTQSWKTSKTPNSLLPSIEKVQGIYVMTSSGDNSSRMEAVKATFEEGRRDDSLKFFVVHQLGLSESHVAAVCGTRRYHGADGFAIVKAIGEKENINTVPQSLCILGNIGI